MVDVMIDCNSFNRQEAVRSTVHHATIVWLHLERTDERVSNTVLLKIVSVSRDSELSNHRHDVSWIAKASCSLDVCQNLWVILVLGNPANFCTLHGIIETNTLDVFSVWLSIVCQLFSERPFTNIINSRS